MNKAEHIEKAEQWLGAAEQSYERHLMRESQPEGSAERRDMAIRLAAVHAQLAAVVSA